MFKHISVPLMIDVSTALHCPVAERFGSGLQHFVLNNHQTPLSIMYCFKDQKKKKCKLKNQVNPVLVKIMLFINLTKRPSFELLLSHDKANRTVALFQAP